jgi:copper chaperone CopZ
MITSRTSLKVEGMTCEGCAQTVRDGLEREPGVQEARVSWQDGIAEVAYDSAETDEQRILKSRVFRRQCRAEAAPPPRCC